MFRPGDDFGPFFKAVLEDYPTENLPPPLTACDDCGGGDLLGCMLIPSRLGRRCGVGEFLVRLCRGCSALHVTQRFERPRELNQQDVALAEAIAAAFGDWERVGEPRPNA